jgi:hypothetical protein
MSEHRADLSDGVHRLPQQPHALRQNCDHQTAYKLLEEGETTVDLASAPKPTAGSSS